MYSTVEDVLAASRAACFSQEDMMVSGRCAPGGDVAFIDFEDLVGATDGVTLSRPLGFVKRPGGYPRRGPGRTPGSALVVRESVYNVLVVLLATSAFLNLTELFEPEEASYVDLEGLCSLRHSLAKVTDRALSTKAWDLSRSGSIGVLLKYGSSGSRDDEGRHLAVAVEATLADKGVVCACSAAEACLRDAACSLQEPMERALDAVRAALGVTMADVFEILSASLRVRSRAVGRAVLYGPSTCVVRMPGGSWPFAVVRKTRSANWICYSCRTSDGSCYHSAAATAEARRSAQGAPKQDSDSDSGTDTGDGGDDGGPEASDAVVGELGVAGSIPAVDGTATGGGRVDRTKQTPQSTQPRHIVPPRAAQVERASILRSLRDTSILLFFPAAERCPFCCVGRCSELSRREVLVECGEGVAKGVIYGWRCGECNLRVIPSGRDRGIVFTSSSTAYSEVFLFETAVSLSRNGCSLRSSSYLREAFRELSQDHVYPDAVEAMSSVSTLRKAVVLYLSLVNAGLPATVTQCATCVRQDGSYATICFDGLQLGYRLKFMVPFSRSAVSVSPIARASVYAHVIRDEALAKALGGVMSSAGSPGRNTITTLSAMRGTVMAFVVLTGYVRVDGVETTLAGSTLGETRARKKERGWDPVEDGGMRLELIEFLRLVFMCRRAARAVAMDIIGGPVDLLRRVPKPLMDAVHDTAADLSEDYAEVSGSDEDGVLANDETSAGVDFNQAAEAAAAEGQDGWASDGDGSDSGGPTAVQKTLVDEIDPGRPYRPPDSFWDDNAPLLSYAELLAEPALADTGGESGAARARPVLLPMHSGFPGTVASTSKVVDFVRAVAVDPFTVWAPCDNWAAVEAVFNCLLDDGFTTEKLADVVGRTDVTELRLLRGAVACLAPALCGSPDTRRVFAELLLSIMETREEYDEYVAAAQAPADDQSMSTQTDGSSDDGDGDEEPYTKRAMVLAHSDESFTPQQFQDTWLVPPATAADYAAAHGLPEGESENFLKTGVWAPGLPLLRSLPGFVGAASAQTDAPNCQHQMGKQQSHTGGTFGGFCTCAHPKCLGVVVLDKSESQRMPIEFVVQRFATLSDTIVYDFACAALKTALVRLPLVAKKVALRVDRFHWRKNHTLCSKAMSPDAYVSMDGTNTSSSEERNAISRRQQHHLRQMKQDAFIIFTVYQQALSNVVAMYRDKATKDTRIKWPEWYRRTHVDKEVE